MLRSRYPQLELVPDSAYGDLLGRIRVSYQSAVDTLALYCLVYLLYVHANEKKKITNDGILTEQKGVRNHPDK